MPAVSPDTFRALHVPGRPLLMPNPFDVGTARLLAGLGFQALATTSSGFAATLGRPDGGVSRDEALAHGASIVEAVDLPVSADLEGGFGDDPETVHETVLRAAAAGLAGCSIEDYSGTAIYDRAQAADRIAAAAEAARQSGLVLTGRAENYFRGRSNLADTIERLQAYQEAGADVLYAPGMVEFSDIREVLRSVDRPVNMLPRPGMVSVAELAEAGVARISIGGAFSQLALGALADAARELLDQGTYEFLALAARGRAEAARAFA
jgi:2-methylisocitrate lyase-like PEP mutase family enzyme